MAGAHKPRHVQKLQLGRTVYLYMIVGTSVPHEIIAIRGGQLQHGRIWPYKALHTCCRSTARVAISQSHLTVLPMLMTSPLDL